VAYRVANQEDITNYVALLTKEGYLAMGRQVVFITHGYMNMKYDESATSSIVNVVERVSKVFDVMVTWMDEIKDEILEQEDSTVIIVSWGKGAVTNNYNLASANTQPVASLVSSFAESILNTDIFKGNPDNIYLYCIGHSLGANICGQAGRMSGHFDRVSGLDPAGPGFETCWSTLHVDKDSAKCVDNIHTDATSNGLLPILPGVHHFGTLRRWGHVDFYPNGGTNQPGCSYGLLCNHVAAIKFFQLSINPKNKCTAVCDGSVGKQSMGYYSSCHRKQPEIKEGSCAFTTGDNSGFWDSVRGWVSWVPLIGKNPYCLD